MALYQKIKKPFQYFFELIYPNLCFGCDEPLAEGEKIICTSCKFDLPILSNPVITENIKEKLADVNPRFVSSFLYFQKGNVTQKLLHTFKYQGYESVGLQLGRWHGEYLKKSGLTSEIDVIVPVPLHRRKLLKRGFNQSEILAKGIAEMVGKPCESQVIKRISRTDSQTRKSRFSRMMNVRQIFRVTNPELIRNTHVLLVDDVITTGSTIAACADALLASGARAISIATLAAAQ